MKALKRLVYADALSQDDDPRGEFISIQCRLAAGRVKTEQAKVLRKREAELLEAHSEEWFGPTEKWLRSNDAYGLTHLKVSRGFVSQCRVQVAGDAGLLKTLFSKAPLLERLIVRGVAVNPVPQLAQLRYLDAEGECAVSLSEALSGSTWPFLRELTLDYSYAKSTKALDFSSLPKLEVLEVRTRETAVRLPKTLERLTWNGALDAKALDALPNLTSLALLGRAPSKPVIAALEPLSSQLESLVVTGKLSDVQPLLAFKWPKLKHLDVSNIPLGPAGAKLLAALKAPSLQSLDLANTRLKAEGAWAVLRSPLLKTLRQLSLRANRLADADLKALGQLEHGLILLNLKKNPLSAGFLKQMGKAFPHTRLSR